MARWWSRQQYTINELRSLTIAVPGTLTAYLALRMCLGLDFKHVVVPFDNCERRRARRVSGQGQCQPIITEGN